MGEYFVGIVFTRECDAGILEKMLTSCTPKHRDDLVRKYSCLVCILYYKRNISIFFSFEYFFFVATFG